MKIVIDIPEDIYRKTVAGTYSPLYDEVIAEAVSNGTPLPNDTLIIIQIDCLMRKEDIREERQRILAEIENDGVVVLPGYMHVAYIGNKCDVETV